MVSTDPTAICSWLYAATFPGCTWHEFTRASTLEIAEDDWTSKHDARCEDNALVPTGDGAGFDPPIRLAVNGAGELVILSGSNDEPTIAESVVWW